SSSRHTSFSRDWSSDVCSSDLSRGIGPLLESHQHNIGQILRETLESEYSTLKLYHELLELVEGKSVLLEEFARDMIKTETLHIGEIDKMLRNPGEIDISKQTRESIG